jgi:hypothetical protein
VKPSVEAVYVAGPETVKGPEIKVGFMHDLEQRENRWYRRLLRWLKKVFKI